MTILGVCAEVHAATQATGSPPCGSQGHALANTAYLLLESHFSLCRLFQQLLETRFLKTSPLILHSHPNCTSHAAESEWQCRCIGVVEVKTRLHTVDTSQIRNGLDIVLGIVFTLTTTPARYCAYAAQATVMREGNVADAKGTPRPQGAAREKSIEKPSASSVAGHSCRHVVAVVASGSMNLRQEGRLTFPRRDLLYADGISR